MFERPVIGMATFARFYDASGPQKVTIVRDARTFVIDPRGYAGRDYYRDLRNSLKQTHWATEDISVFEDALDSMVATQSISSKQDHYRKLGQGYIDHWHKHDAGLFDIQDTRIEIAGLTILVNPEIGMRHYGDGLAVKLWFAAQRPKRQYRQAIRYLMDEAQRLGWCSDLQPALWDVRREIILQHVPIPKDFPLAIEAQAVAFQQIWDSLGAAE